VATTIATIERELARERQAITTQNEERNNHV